MHSDWNKYTSMKSKNSRLDAIKLIISSKEIGSQDELLQELTLMYNKTRQQAITSELLDIVGGQMA